ncbi:MAG: N-formylglutamate amidohydrolase [Rhodobacteraceae bacterium]|uniref:N-formylglutamate amidohydrolase n=1 Tax=Amaricoccus sp. TaxID=1872485 RepID=UPI001DFB9737|nr:N-formylglutamate amidohydrolase [Amaricoccus sp.]MCB1372836.1 N-formylglutamate amidohydrolase [Paracoccaceae bacterium]MCB1401739.1 N-formylglutamate amidohydrolase [Paracoccaceae bacterium]MCC0067817.1 N-formylglutamate amidohydrolase [Rhodovulum sp.]HRW15486.1 N-formylglutamate amidohydrolase [Amaricoccus sp.]
MNEQVFSLRMPVERSSCAVFNSPHSGRDYPAAFLESSRLDPLQIRSSEDAFVDELFARAPECGAPLLAARVPRAFLDLNRGPEDLDPALIDGAARRAVNPRIVAGLGVIPRVVAEGRPIIEGKLTLAEAEQRIAAHWHPYHAELATLVDGARARFGSAILFDCHSMPHDALATAPVVWGRRPDVILGDRFGAACDRWLIDAATEIFTAAGFVVARNAPFAGGYITQAYGRPRMGVHALQIEIDRALYMDEARVERLPCFEQIRGRIGAAVARLSELGPREMRVAAE